MSAARDVDSTLALLGGPAGDPVVDFLVDPHGARAALADLAEHAGMVIRVAPELAPNGEGMSEGATHAPPPRAPLFLRLMRGAREVGLAREDVGMVRMAERVVIEERDRPCCDAATCDRRRVAASVWVELADVRAKAQDPEAPRRVLVAEERIIAADGAAPSHVLAVGHALAAALGVPLVRSGTELAIDAAAEDPREVPAPHEALAARDLARFALRTEGDLVVLRDWDSAGPKASAPRNAAIGVGFLVVAAIAILRLARALQAGANNEAIATGAIAALLVLAGYAFLGVARFSARYRATSAPLAAIGPDRIAVLPWVDREGAVDVRPEGRLGAAIKLGDVSGLATEPREDGVAVVLVGDHGPIDLMVCASAATAETWRRALERVIDEARHPRKGTTARQRLRARAA